MRGRPWSCWPWDYFAGVCAVGVQRVPMLKPFEDRSIDTRYQIRGAHRGASATAIVALDAKSLRELGRIPVPRRFVARVVDNLRRAGARVIVSGLSLEQQSDDAPGDRALARALARAPAAAVAVSTIRELGLTEPLVGSVPST